MSKMIKLTVLLIVIGLSVSANANDGCVSQPTCANQAGNDAVSLHLAYASTATSSEQRAKMIETIAKYTNGKITNWKSAANEYFAWRREHVPDSASAFSSTSSNQLQAGPDYARMRAVTEEAIRRQLVDPASAQFEWPYGFTRGEWKRLLRSRVNGLITCGFVNSRNRMGGYAGRTAFAVVFDFDGSSIQHLEVGDNRRSLDLTAMVCDKSAGMFPPPQRELLQTATPASSSAGSVADELAKLAQLRDSGALTEAEFQVAKQRLLSR